MRLFVFCTPTKISNSLFFFPLVVLLSHCSCLWELARKDASIVLVQRVVMFVNKCLKCVERGVESTNPRQPFLIYNSNTIYLPSNLELGALGDRKMLKQCTIV